MYTLEDLLRIAKECPDPRIGRWMAETYKAIANHMGIEAAVSLLAYGLGVDTRPSSGFGEFISRSVDWLNVHAGADIQVTIIEIDLEPTSDMPLNFSIN